ncbi:MAG: acetyltransferase [Muribaculaceae bacterium]|nr:acetyltransferase [Muribaculaceae bacterium]
MKNLYIIGARGFGREVFELFQECNFDDIQCIGFLDDKSDALECYPGYPPIISNVEDFIPDDNDIFICALGDVRYKRKYVNMILEKGGRFINLIHPTAYISQNSNLGKGCIICAYTRISCDVTIGDFNTFQPFCMVGHDVKIGDYCHFNTYSFLGGFVSIENESTLHTGAVIHPHKSIGTNCIVGAGSIVIKNVKSNTTVFGNPAKKLLFE